jgi:transcription elongation factor SPT5
MVPIKEMTDVLRVVKDVVRLKPGTWVRFKRTLYKDDLAQVEAVDTAQNNVTLKVIPRIDYARKRGQMKDSSASALDDLKRKRRPPQKLFDSDAVRSIGGDPTKEKGRESEYWTFENNRYNHRGFLIKNFPMSAIITEGVKPTLAELQKFENSMDGLDLEATSMLSKTAMEKNHTFAAGDVVEVCQGELIHLTGVIIGIDGDKIKVLPQHEELKDPIDFMANELKKHFKVGEHVKVIGGRFEGETGLIVKVEDHLATLISDLTMDEVKVLPRQLQLCQSTATGVDALGKYEWGDLVQIE